jgi:hypothetical protein
VKGFKLISYANKQSYQSFQGRFPIYSFNERIVSPLVSLFFKTFTKAKASSRFVITSTLNSTMFQTEIPYHKDRELPQDAIEQQKPAYFDV